MTTAGRRVGGRDAGSISGFVVVMTLAVLMCAALVIDGARSVATHVRAADHAENAARVAAQELTSLRSGVLRLDIARARAAALEYLADHDVQGTVHVTDERATVTVTLTTSTVLLQLVGVTTLRSSATRSSQPVKE